jgi:hypothetical protein
MSAEIYYGPVYICPACARDDADNCSGWDVGWCRREPKDNSPMTPEEWAELEALDPWLAAELRRDGG